MEGTAVISASDLTESSFEQDWYRLYQESLLNWGDIADILVSMGAALTKGWVKAELYNGRGMCMFGAFIYGTGAKRSKNSLESRVIGALLEQVIRGERPEFRVPGNYKSWNVAVWFNDHEHTVKRDILHVIERAVKVARAMNDDGMRIIPQDYPNLWAQPPVTNFIPVMPKPGSVSHVALVPAGV